MKKRYWEIDFLRGIAIIMMIIFHLIWNIVYFYDLNIALTSGFWNIFRIITASLFLFLVGISLTISNIRKNAGFYKYLKRGLRIIFLGLIITIVTRFIFPNNYIIFGILHLIGLSIILSYFFRNLKYLNLVFGIITITIGFILSNYLFNSDYLLILGIHSTTFTSLDYYPLFPWFGIVLIGLFIGKIFYADGKRNFKIVNISNNIIIKFLCFLGRKSLIIYFLHQIILYSILWILVNML